MSSSNADVDTGLLDAILARPDDDEPRLVYADALMQRNDPRGELIRVQCALARHEATDEDVGDVGRLRSRERALLKKHYGEWTAGLPSSYSVSYEHRRGFIEAMTGNGEELAAIAPLRATVVPLLRSFATTSFTGATVPFTDDAAAASWLEGLSLQSPHSEAIAKIAASPHLGRLRRLATKKAWLEGDAMRLVATLPQPLEELSLGFDGRLSSVGNFVKQLTGCPARASLRRLALYQLRHLSPLGAAAAALTSLEQLTLENADLERAPLMKLASSLPRLTSLDVAENYSQYTLEKLDAAALVASLPSLRWLRLNKLGLGDKQAIALAESPDAARLTRLDLGRNRITEVGALAIARSPHLRGLRRLNLNANQLPDGAKAALRESFAHAALQLR